ncbi:MAG TPA: CRTAC1 family protein [Thermoanaerobaculia bacterium]|jgi:hypothetical protein|nr:CRTAC1 family protein [Thermoanaerobaculia bacterium]
MSIGERLRAVQKRPLFFGLTLVPAVAVYLAWTTARQVEPRGRAFFERGKTVVVGLDALARALRAGDLPAAERLYAADYRGSALGLLERAPVQQRSGIRALRFAGAGAGTDRGAALDEWRRYVDGFDNLESLELHLHRFDSWQDTGDLHVRVRFEAIGTPRGAGHPVIDRAIFRLALALGPEGPRIKSAELVDGERVESERPWFADVAHSAGVDFTNRWYPGFLDRPLRFGMIRYGPAGISAADVDGDGFYDLFVPDGVESRLFRNRGDGTFEDVTAAAGLAGLSGVSVGVFGDYDNDGRRDLFVSRTFEPNQLFHNEGPDARGRVRFADVTARSGIGADCCTTVASWADYDGDGRLDLYVGRYLDPRTKIPTTFYARNGEPNQLYHNDGDGRFTNVTEEAGVGEVGLCLGTAFGDYDDDGWPDIYVANDFGRKTLYHNDGPADGPRSRPTFSDVTVESGTLAYGAGMSSSFGDYDNDGRLDLYVAQIRSEHAWFAETPTVHRDMLNSWRQGVWKSDMPLYLEIFRQSGFAFVDVFQQMASGNNLLRNRGDGTFEDVTAETGTNPLGWFWGSAFADFDNDGWQDIYSTNGWVYNDPGTEIELDFLNNVVSRQDEYKKGTFFDPKYFGRQSWHGYERNRFLHNEGPGPRGRVGFREVGRATGSDLLLNSRGIAVADFWNRGRLDIAVAASTDRHALLRNDFDDGDGWLEVELVGTTSNRDAVGARVTARAGNLRLTREVSAGDGYGSQNQLRLHFGLGKAQRVDELVVRWPRADGGAAPQRVQTFRNVAGQRIVEITEGRDAVIEKRYGAPAG